MPNLCCSSQCTTAQRGPGNGQQLIKGTHLGLKHHFPPSSHSKHNNLCLSGSNHSHLEFSRNLLFHRFHLSQFLIVWSLLHLCEALHHQGTKALVNSTVSLCTTPTQLLPSLTSDPTLP